MSQSEMGGIKFASLSVSGKGILDTLSMESGVHRVQVDSATPSPVLT